MNPRLILGLALALLGVVAMVYQEFSYTTEETILQVGALKATAEVENSIAIPEVLGICAIVIGLLLIVLNAWKK